jgi:hypothetical protein
LFCRDIDLRGVKNVSSYACSLLYRRTLFKYAPRLEFRSVMTSDWVVCSRVIVVENRTIILSPMARYPMSMGAGYLSVSNTRNLTANVPTI